MTVDRNYLYKTFGIERSPREYRGSAYAYLLFKATGSHRIGVYFNHSFNHSNYSAYIEISPETFTIEKDDGSGSVEYSTYNVRGANFPFKIYRNIKDSGEYEYLLKPLLTNWDYGTPSKLRFNLIYGTPDLSDTSFTLDDSDNNIFITNVNKVIVVVDGKDTEQEHIYSDVMPGMLWAKEGIDGSINADDLTIDVFTTNAEGKVVINDDMQFVTSVKDIVRSMAYTGIYETK